MTEIDPQEVYPPGGREPRYRILDVRAPQEVARGSLPGAVNLPILSDEERHRVGIRYKEAGQQAAITLGEELTRSQLPERVRAWREVCSHEPTAVSCWRGGLRSELAQHLIERPEVPRVRGGYKALRRHLTTQMTLALSQRRTLVIAGLTGSGKTELLTELRSIPNLLVLDLEAAAEHRGSSFGATGEQPSQQLFEHRLALPLTLHHAPLLIVEDESHHVGRRKVPEALFQGITGGEILLLESSDEERLCRIHREYVLEPTCAGSAEATLARLTAGVRRLTPRLGGKMVDGIIAILRDNYGNRGSWLDPRAFAPAILPLLHSYYDPLYHRALQRLARPVLAQGDREELKAWLSKQTSG